jgi:acetylornithine deacetylase/succinyl-diaminopimelate desuccinylase-like protein
MDSFTLCGMDEQQLSDYVNETWDRSILPRLSDYVRIPNKSPNFDPDWDKHGYMDQAVTMLEDWCRGQAVKGMQVEVMRLPGRTPLLFLDIPGQSDDVVLLYGHYDKQPEFSGWMEGLDPWQPVIRDGRLYGRGGADDGYAVFGSLTAIRALQEQGIPHARCVVLIEGCEESGSFDLPHYIDALGERIGTPSLVVCLDAECGNYEQFWCTTSLRGNLVGTLTVEVLREGVHSGSASGVVPSSFRILRQLLSRIEDPASGEILTPELTADIPEARQRQAERAAEVLDDSVWRRFPWVDERAVATETPLELLLDNTWRPTLAVTGADGLPALVNAGNVLLPGTTLKLSFRLPPTCDAHSAANAVKKALEENPPVFAKVAFKVESTMGGWNAPAIADWLDRSIQSASQAHFGKPSMYMGTGGSIPFMGMLGARFPDAQFLVTGLLGPNSNAHGPNEFLHIETGKRLTACVSHVLKDHFERS